MLKRAELAKKYLTGCGIEIGALHCPTPVPPGVSVTYVDQAPEVVARNHGDVTPRVSNWVVDDAGELRMFALASLDFVMAHHVLEHLEEPLGAIKTWFSKLKDGGMILFSLPNKDHTFDRKRPITPFGHILADHMYGPERSRFEHMMDWYANAEQEGRVGHDLVAAAMKATENDTNIHFHVWDFPAMCHMISKLKLVGSMPDFECLEAIQDGAECTFVLRKIGGVA